MIVKEHLYYDYADAVSEKTHPAPDNDSRFYQKSKSEFSLNNVTIAYRKYRKKFLTK